MERVVNNAIVVSSDLMVQVDQQIILGIIRCKYAADKICTLFLTGEDMLKFVSVLPQLAGVNLLSELNGKAVKILHDEANVYSIGHIIEDFWVKCHPDNNTPVPIENETPIIDVPTSEAN